MRRIKDWQVCQMCHGLSGCDKCCRKCDKPCNRGQICGLQDKMSVKIFRWENWSGLKKEEAMGVEKTGRTGTAIKQPELPGMPKRSPAGEKAEEFLNLKSQIEKDQEALDDLGKELIALMHKENRSSIKIGGASLQVKFIESKEKLVLKKNETS